MMPGVNQSAAGGIASEATSVTCQNCTILNQSLHEYVAALLTLKQKIIDTEESAELHKELDEVLLKLVPLEKQTAEYEAIKTELEETKATLKAYQVKSEEVDALREKNAKTLATNSKLQEAIKTAEDAARTQNQESSKLRSDNAVLESDLQKTREALRLSEQAVEEMDNLKLQNAKALIVKGNLENQLLALEDTNLKLNHTIQDLKSKNSNLENSVGVMEERLVMFEKEFNKDNQCFLSRLPRSPPPPMPTSPFRNPNPRLTVSTPKGAEVSPDKSNVKSTLIGTRSPSKDQRKKKISRKKKRSLESVILEKSCVKTDEVSDSSPTKDGPDDHLLEAGRRSETPDVWEILSLSWSLPALLSPLPPDELVEMEVDSSLTEGSVLKTEDEKNTSQSTEPKPLNNGVAASSAHLSPGNQPNMSITSDNDNKSPQKMINESQEMHVEIISNIQENLEESPCTTSTANSNDKLDEEHVNSNQATVTKSESQLSTKEENEIQINKKQQCNADHELLQANSNDCVREGSEPVKQVEIFEKSPEKKDNCVQPQAEVESSVPEYPLQISVTPDTCSKTEPGVTVEEIQNVLKMADDQNGVTSIDSSDEDEFFSLKRKVRGGSLRPANLDREPSNELVSNEKEECVAHVQETNCNYKEEHLQTENVNNDECLKDCSITMNSCTSVIPEDDIKTDVDVVRQETRLVEKYTHESESNSLTVLDDNNQQEEGVECVKEENTKTKVPNFLSICPASLVNSDALSGLHKNKDIPLIDVASQNVPTSTQSPESIGKVLSEMGPPLPPVVLPLTATPPKFVKQLIANRPSFQLSTWSLTEGPFSPKQQSKIPSPNTGLQDQANASLSVATPSPSRGVPSSPLQFGSATPKHALPVPGRLPSSALHSSSSSVSQENSMQILDTMYPELSAQARTLNILRGNVNLGRPASENGSSSPSLNPISGNKTINSSSTAFKKTDQKAKRIGANVLLPKSAKRLRLDTFSPDPASLTPPVQQVDDNKPSNDEAAPTYCPLNRPSGDGQTAETERETVDDSQSIIFNALEKLNHLYFDLLPVIRSHVFLGRISEIPVLRDEEKSVISDFCLKQVSD
ncbi:Little elongation complex subunit 1 [Bagarius yarrelli]|uniref:Little elongation complex subunit 1 n=1 Tax=Bagarius yarrelli TaxID=175774 RepID=A0A556U1A8_BAGYA|nr:Little elongation complex subunit 1 [Bagarius yarrelli]